MQSNKFWKALKDCLDWSARRTMWQIVAATLICPFVEAILVNLWTGAPNGQGYIPGMTLLAVVVIHFPLALLIIADESNSPEKVLADAVEAENELGKLRKELARRTNAYRMVVSAVQTFNAEACRIDPFNFDGICKVVSFEEGLKPVIQEFVKNINITLGVSSHQFSLEVYLQPDIRVSTKEEGPCTACHGMFLRCFCSSHGDRCAPTRLTHNSPAHLGKAKLVPTEQHIDADKALFYTDGRVKPEVYFRRFATTTINWPCSESVLMGVLVLTSMQDEPFAEDVLETMRFMASVISNYANKYSACVAWQRYYEKEAAKQVAQNGH